MTLSVDEFMRDPVRHLERVTRRGERLVLARDDVPVAEVTPSESVEGSLRVGALPEAMEALPSLSRKEADAFARDLETLRRSTTLNRLRDPWTS